MNRENLVRTIKDILQSSGIKKAYLFGSFARNEKKYHDIDIAIKPPKDF
jgi:predicted nucleotidyltransferase